MGASASALPGLLLALLALGWAPEALPTDNPLAPEGGCSAPPNANTRNLTTLADGCARTWPVDSDNHRPITRSFYPWDDAAYLTNETVRTRLSGSCPSVEVRGISTFDGLARARCVCGEASGCNDAEFLVNMDLLACHPDNVRSYEEHMPTEPAHQASDLSCPPDEDAFTRRARERIARSMAHESTPLGHSGFATAHGAESVVSEYGRELVNAALARYRAVQTRAERDHFNMQNLYNSKSPSEVHAAFTQAQERLQGYAANFHRKYGPNCNEILDGTNSFDGGRGQRACRTVRDGLAWLNRSLEQAALHGSSADAQGGYLKSLEEMQLTASDVGYSMRHSHVRNALFYGLSNAERNALTRSGAPAQDRICFARRMSRSEAGASDFVELHGGYVFGGRRLGHQGDRNIVANACQPNGYDCSDFITDILNAQSGGRAAAPNTEVMRQAAHYLALPPGRRPARAPNPLVNCFNVVDVRGDEPVLPGDLLVSRLRGAGHVALVENYDHTTGLADTIETASGESGTTGLLSRPLFEPMCGSAAGGRRRAFRAGLSVLRFNPREGCPFTESR